MDTIIQPVTIRAKRVPYRRHSDEFKRAAVARTLVAGTSVSLIARELKINANQLFGWRKRFAVGVHAGGNAPGQLVAVTVLDTPRAPASAPAASVPPGVIVLSVGQAQLRHEAQVDATALALLLARLLPWSVCPQAPRSGWPPA